VCLDYVAHDFMAAEPLAPLRHEGDGEGTGDLEAISARVH
jgi:hypothetical protein